MSDRDNRRTVWFLAVGAVIGLGLAASETVEKLVPLGDAPVEGVMASINGQPVYTETFEKHLSGLRQDKRNPLSEQDIDFILERIIEEELLIQRGVEIGLTNSDRRVRAAIVQSMINSVLADVQAQDVSEQDLQTFFTENKNFFAKTERAHIAHMTFRFANEEEEEQARERAELARKLIGEGQAFDTVAKDLGDQIIARVPDTLLPPVKIREYVGPDLLPYLSQIPKGEVSTVLRTDRALHLIWMKDRTEGAIPSFDDVSALVDTEFRRRRDDAALKDYLEFLKSRGDVQRYLKASDYLE